MLNYGCQKTAVLPPTPKVNAGPAQTVNMPTDTAYLTGSATDSVSAITGYIWSQISGPNTAVFSDDGSPNTTVSGLIYATVCLPVGAPGCERADGCRYGDRYRNQQQAAKLLTLTTLFPGTSYSPYEMMYLGNATEYNPGNSVTPELLAENLDDQQYRSLGTVLL